MKVGIITITIGENIGNKLQNYALQKTLLKYVDDCQTLKYYECRKKELIKKILKRTFFYKKFKNQIIRTKNFEKFKKNIKYSDFTISNEKIPMKKIKEFDSFIAGSDQIWNLHYKDNSKAFFLGFCDKNKKLTYAPSFGSSIIPNNVPNEIIEWIKDIKCLSVREESGKNIIKKLTGRKDVEVLIDPTMLLTPEEWDKVSNRPKQLDKIKKEKYILNYFLGNLSDSRKKEIEKIAKKYDCHIINILDKKDPFYTSGPSEFLYLEKHAFLICTDSFHSSVFAILYNRPFVIFDREQKEIENMNSRIDTLIDKFKLKNRRYNGKNITEENLNHDYTEAYKILEKERKKSDTFLRKALDIKEGE